MKKNKIYSALIASTLVATSVTFAQTEGNGMPPPPPNGEGRGGMMRQMWGEKREDHKEARQEFREDMKDARQEFRDDMKERKEYMMGSSTSGTATPTPWRNFKENMKEARGEWKDKMKDMRDDMKDKMHDIRENMMRMPMLSATATAQLAAKLGMTPEALQAKLASGTKLRELVKDKISPEDMRNILPPQVATFTKRIENRGFFQRLFGPQSEEVKFEYNQYGEVVGSSTSPVEPRGFFRRLFNW